MPTATLVFPLLEIELWCVSQMGQAHLGASITLSPPFVQSLVTGLVFELALPGGRNRAERGGEDAQSRRAVSGLALSRSPRLKGAIYCAPLRKSHG